MKILKHVETLKTMAAEHGDYRVLAEKTGVTYHWLQKFAIGVIDNPKINNVAKLESYFFADHQDAD